MESVLDGLRSGLIYQHIQFDSVTLHFASKHPPEMVGVFLYTSMKSFIQFLESKNFMESSDSILDGLIQKAEEEIYDDTSMLILADYLESIRKVKESQIIRDNVVNKEEPPQIAIANALELPHKNHLYYEMYNFLARMMKRITGEIDDWSIEGAIRWFACDNYSGQGSDLYSICSTSEYRPGFHTESITDEDEIIQKLYGSLERKF